MELFRNTEVRVQTLLHLGVTVIGFMVCLFLSVPAAFVLLGVSCITLAAALLLHRKRFHTIAQLCDQISSILQGSEEIMLSQFHEGEMSILSTEIHKMTTRLREQNACLQRDRRFMKEAMEDLSHQLRTPLTSMMLILGMLRQPELTKQQRMEYLQELYTLLDRMQWQIDTLLGLSRLEADAVTFRTDTVQCSTLIDRALEPISVALELKGITIRVEITGEPSFRGDLQYCTEALGNLLKNCMEHTPSGGTVTIQAEQNSIYTSILITDSGSGIPEEQLSHLFERFYRASEFGKKGYGIGLAFAQRIIAAQNGSLQVKNVLPHGAQFDLRMYRTVV